MLENVVKMLKIICETVQNIFYILPSPNLYLILGKGVECKSWLELSTILGNKNYLSKHNTKDVPIKKLVQYKYECVHCTVEQCTHRNDSNKQRMLCL